MELKNVWGSDIETNGLMPEVDTFHTGVLINLETGATERYADQPLADLKGGFKEYVARIEEIMASPDGMIIGHNFIKYDIPVINLLKQKYFGKRLNYNRKRIIDTLVISRLVHSNIADTDSKYLKSGRLPGRLFKSHGLEAWGYRMGLMKGEYKDDFKKHCIENDIQYEPGDEWRVASQEMLDYNVQDVVVTNALFQLFMQDTHYFTSGIGQESVTLEHEAAWTMARMERNGYPIDIDGLERLSAELRGKRANILMDLVDTFGSWYEPNGGKVEFKHPRTGKRLLTEDGEEKYPRVTVPKQGGIYLKGKGLEVPKEKRKLSSVDYMEGAPFTPVKYVTFNPASGDHLAAVLIRRGWKPIDFTPTGKPVVDDEVLEHVKMADPKDQAALELVREYLTLQKRIGQMAEGKNAWLRLVWGDGRIHGSINTNGAVTGRATHSYPNVAQVPANGKLYGSECRAAFGAKWNKRNGKPDPWVQVGVDASGLELRCLGHFLSPYDNNNYADTVVDGDIHWENAKNSGLAQNVPRDKHNPEHEAWRNNAKTFIYAFLYGAGAAKIGLIVNGGKREGKALITKFLDGTPAIKALREDLEKTLVKSAQWVEGKQKVVWKRRWVKGLDGRKVHVRSPHSSLNTLLQSAGALICKKWVVVCEEMTEAAGYKHGWDGDIAFMAWIHDEIQIACRTQEIADHVIQIAQEAMRIVGEYFNFRCVLDTEGKSGPTWKECH